jgi:hypothetical protein
MHIIEIGQWQTLSLFYQHSSKFAQIPIITMQKQTETNDGMIIGTLLAL